MSHERWKIEDESDCDTVFAFSQYGIPAYVEVGVLTDEKNEALLNVVVSRNIHDGCELKHEYFIGEWNEDIDIIAGVQDEYLIIVVNGMDRNITVSIKNQIDEPAIIADISDEAYHDMIELGWFNEKEI